MMTTLMHKEDTAEIFETQDTSGINSINTRNEGTDTSATGMDSYMKEYLRCYVKNMVERRKMN